MNIFEIITFKYPGIQQVSYWGTQYDGTPWNDPYDGLIWENKDIPKPTKEELALWEKEYEPVKYEIDQRQKRRNEYPAFGDQLDAILKHVEQRELEGIALAPELKAIKDEWRAVKTKYPLEK
jgi:hypothetical protein